jgi:hypothetical protein
LDDLAVISEHEARILYLDRIASTQHDTRSTDTARSIVAFESKLAHQNRR